MIPTIGGAIRVILHVMQAKTMGYSNESGRLSAKNIRLMK
jgi:hypothetical protein